MLHTHELRSHCLFSHCSVVEQIKPTGVMNAMQKLVERRTIYSLKAIKLVKSE
jgi:hypothetical protein